MAVKRTGLDPNDIGWVLRPRQRSSVVRAAVEHAGKTIAYSGDTTWTDSLVDASRVADLFICEAYTYQRDVRYHLSYKRLRAERHRLSCRRIVLTHMSADMLAHAPDVDLECADDDMVKELYTDRSGSPAPVASRRRAPMLRHSSGADTTAADATHLPGSRSHQPHTWPATHAASASRPRIGRSCP